MGDESRFRYRRDDGAAERAARERGAPASSGGGDPLAELARLIGDNDPFDDFADMPVQQAPQRQLPAQRPAAVQPAYVDPRQAQRAPAYAAPVARQAAAQPASYYDDDDADDAENWAAAPQPAPSGGRYASVPARAAPASVPSPAAYRAPAEAPASYPSQDGTVRLGYGSLARSMPARQQQAVIDDEDDYEDEVPARGQPAYAQPARTTAPQARSVQAYSAPADDDDDDRGYDDRAAYGRGQEPRRDEPRREEARYGNAHAAAARYDDEDDGQEAAYAYSAPRRDDDGYDDYDDTYDPEYADDGYMPPHGEDIYDQEPRRRRGRMALLLGVSLLGLLVAGAAGVFAYNMAVGKHAMSAGGAPPVIKADAGSSKTVSATPPPAADGQQKLIYDRLGGSTTAANERVVPREEQPVDVTAAVSKSYAAAPAAPDAAAPATPVAPAAQSGPPSAAPVAASPSLNEPKKVRTLAVRADTGAPSASASPVTAYAANPAPSLPDPASAATAAAAQNAGAANSGAPNAAPPNATAMPTPLASGAFVVQVASQRTEADANGSWRALQQKYPNILGSYRASVKKADLGDRGIFYRAQVGPFATRDQANQLCQALHAQGGDCIVAKN